MKYEFIADHASDYPIERLSEALGVSRSGYYAWKTRPESQHHREDGVLKSVIEHTYQSNKGRYGSPRILVELQAQGYRCSRKRVARLMREQGLCARKSRRSARTTRADPTHPKVGNLLNQEFEASSLNQKWVADITAVWTQEGWLYVAGILDLFSRSVVGWAMSAHQDELLVHHALEMALFRRNPPQGLLHHSDQGSPYTSSAYRELLAQRSFAVSMSRTGNCYDNAPMESFWSSLKWECTSGLTFFTRDDARQAIFEYIECFYHRCRRHSALGYLSPSQYEELMT